MKKRSTIAILCMLILGFSTACNHTTGKNGMIGKYKIVKYTPVDSSVQTLEKIQRIRDWVLSFEENDNFILKGNKKNVVGYWAVNDPGDGKYQLIMQGGGWTISGRSDGKNLYFDAPYNMFDSLFLHIVFSKSSNE